jgi:hypothetical protein
MVVWAWGMDAVRTLLTTSVDSLEKLELVALLHRHPVGWTTFTAAEQLRIAPDLAARALEELRAAGILVFEKDSGYHCKPSEVVQQLADLYENDRVQVLTILASTALDRIRSSAAHTFADAFRLRGKKKEEPDE